MYTNDRDRILNNIRINPETSCWEWQLCLDKSGYGWVCYMDKRERAHRLSFILLSNPSKEVTIEKGMLVCHTCDNPKCVNPTHLWLGTYKDNWDDSVHKNRNTKGEAHGLSKLTDDDVLDIRYKYSTGFWTQTKLALEFGVDQSTISDVVRRTIWKHI